MVDASQSSTQECRRKCTPIQEGGQEAAENKQEGSQEAAESNEEIRKGGQKGESSCQTYVITQALHAYRLPSHNCWKRFTVAGANPAYDAGNGHRLAGPEKVNCGSPFSQVNFIHFIPQDAGVLHDRGT
jgi:hypothetical protein